MRRMLLWAGIGTFVGFSLFCVLFSLAFPDRGPDRFGVVIAFSVLGAIPVGGMGAIFMAVGIIKDEIDVVRREISRLERIEEIVVEQEKQSTQIRSKNSRSEPL